MYVAYNLDKVLLGRFCGAEVLGTYGRAYQLVNIPTENLNAAVGGVAFSALSRLQNDPPRLRSYFLKGYSLVLSLTIPITIACILFGSDIVFVVLGSKWMPAAPLLKLMAPTIFVFALINPLSWLMFSSNLAGRSLRIALVIAPLVVVGYLIGLPYGSKGVAIGFSATMTILAIPVSVWAVRGTAVSPQDLWTAASRALLSGVAAAAMSLIAQSAMDRSLSPYPRLVIEVSLLSLVYAWMLLHVMGQKAFYWELLRAMMGRAPTHQGR